MSKFDLASSFKSIQGIAMKHSPEILTGIGIVGMISSTVLAVRSTPKALILIENRKREIRLESVNDTANKTVKSDDLSAFEIIRTTWKCYIPSVITGACSIACLIGANSVNARRNAALAAAYTLSETAFSDYKAKVIEKIGDKKEKSVRDDIAQDKLNESPIVAKEIVVTGKGETRFYDALIGRRFDSDIEFIRRAVNNLNERLLFDMYVSLNEFYDEIGLDEIHPLGDDLGWTVNPDSSDKGLIQLDFSSLIDSDGTPCIVLGFSNPPYYDFAH